MRVFNTNDIIVNVEDNCPSIARLVESGAEELPVEIFGEYAHMATNENTYRNESGEWIFDFDIAAYESVRLEQIADTIRDKRDSLLTQSDWTQLPDAPCDAYAWAAYRQALRDVPQQTGFPNSVTWPNKPE